MSDLSLAFTILGRDRQAVSTFNRVADAAEKSGKRVKHAFHGVGAQVLAGLGVGSVTAGIAQSIRAAGDYQASLTSLVTGAGESQKNLALVGKGMLDLSSQVGASAVDLSKGMYLIESSGQHGAAGLKVLKAAAEGAQVGTADMATVADGLTTALNDYKIPASQAAAVTSKLVATVAAGKTHMGDLAGALATVLPSASAAKVGLTQVLGAMATMTAAGTPAAVAATYLKQTIAQLENPTAKAALEMKSLGLSSVDVAQHLGKRGLTGTLTLLTDAIQRKMGPQGTVLIEQLKKASKHTSTFQKVLADLPPVQQTYVAALATMVGGTKSMQAALQLTGSNAVTFANNVKTIGAATTEAGGHVKGFALSQQDFNNQIDDLKAKVNTFEIQVGTKILPVLSKFIDGMSNGTGAGGKFATVVKDLGRDADQAWKTVKPMFTFIGDHPKLFAEVAKDAAGLALALKGIGLVKGLGTSLGGGKVAGKVLGSVASKANPVPVLVVNPGFGKGLPGLPGPGKTVEGTVIKDVETAAEGGVLAKILAKGKGLVGKAGPTAVLTANVILDPKAIKGLKDTVFPLRFNLSVNDAAKEFLANLKDPGTDKATRAILQRHFDAVFTGVAAASKTGSTKVLTQALNATYADLAKHSGAIQKAIAHQAAVDTAKNVKLISGGLLSVKDLADRTSKTVAADLTTGMGGGLGRAKERADALADSVNGKLKGSLQGANAESRLFLQNLGLIPKTKVIDVRAVLTTTGRKIQLGTVHSSGNTLYIQGRGGKLALADGGWALGPGSSRSDSIPAMLSNREFVMREKVASKYPRQMEALNAGVPLEQVASRGGVQVHFHDGAIRTADPVRAAHDVIRRQRDQLFLAGL